MRTFVRILRASGVVAEPPYNPPPEHDEFSLAELRPDTDDAFWLDVTGLDPVPQDGWIHDDGAFSVPPPAEPQPLQPEEQLRVLKAEAGMVITAVISGNAQLNLNAAMNVIGAKPVSQRSADERAFVETFAEGHAWIQAVRARIPELMASGGQTPAGEERWPVPSQAVRDLAARY